MRQIWDFQNELEKRGITWDINNNQWGMLDCIPQVEKLAGAIDGGLLVEMCQLAEHLFKAADRIGKAG
jgi:hypothetical protein